MNKGYKLNTPIMPNNNEKEAMTQPFSCEDGPKSLKD